MQVAVSIMTAGAVGGSVEDKLVDEVSTNCHLTGWYIIAWMLFMMERDWNVFQQ